MDDLNSVISKNLKKIRKEKGLSLDALSTLTGVSKSMLGQIEREEVNPTISTILKIANGLKVSFTSLMKKETLEVNVIRSKDLEPVFEGVDHKLYSVIPYEDDKHFETCIVEIMPGHAYLSEGHIKGTEEIITIFEGELTLTLDKKEYILSKHDSIRFMADKAHTYENKGISPAKIHLVLYYHE
ncbi:putative transcriptional regulator, XRE family [Methanococcus vannielii SB]|uniref:Transcriptional regulator, XRE family n=1 Tax=Methanococcus vannielii (strain ATCC 35089 / DSM 1224 / JCM 13029 / OCM 148 / SB) TaxID=406327 RepID=A6UR87_METVS|nr:helix-turn-helix domain-containing protein [Methanococcus vannielii]ABR55009.1 putative transcriptional regulator, XRE family [Methanococcus vannielii SB]